MTFLDIPFDAVRDSFTDVRFLGAVALANFLIVPPVVAGLHAVIPLSDELVIPVLIVLLTPCIDYVLVFTRLAGGDHVRLLALTPVLMIVQIILLPVYLWMILGGTGVGAITPDQSSPRCSSSSSSRWQPPSWRVDSPADRRSWNGASTQPHSPWSF